MNEKVYVGMSGGVDSSVTAALLKHQGYEVTGVYMKNWTKDIIGFECPWRQDLSDAKSVAARLDIPFKIFDFENQYKQKVVDYMVEEYRKGRTPNPDIMCNQEIKFKLFLDTALEDGADKIATGHYARIKNGKLYAGIDDNKDQSYFLYRVTEVALQKSLMPIGEYHKPEVRKLATKYNLPTAEKKDSQGICFIGEVDLKDFLKQYIAPKPGPIKNQHGKIVGEHEGAAYYTIGQRHGLGVGGGLPYYVVSKDMKTNTVFVTSNIQDKDLKKDKFRVKDTHWINEVPDLEKNYQVRTRYRGGLIRCNLTKENANSYSVVLDHKERAVTPGQSAVIYDGDRVLGGGIIS